MDQTGSSTGNTISENFTAVERLAARLDTEDAAAAPILGARDLNRFIDDE